MKLLGRAKFINPTLSDNKEVQSTMAKITTKYIAASEFSAPVVNTTGKTIIKIKGEDAVIVRIFDRNWTDQNYTLQKNERVVTQRTTNMLLNQWLRYQGEAERYPVVGDTFPAYMLLNSKGAQRNGVKNEGVEMVSYLRGMTEERKLERSFFKFGKKAIAKAMEELGELEF